MTNMTVMSGSSLECFSSGVSVVADDKKTLPDESGSVGLDTTRIVAASYNRAESNASGNQSTADKQPALEFTDEDFEKWKLMLEEKTGIFLTPQQRVFLQAQLSIRLRELGDITLDEYAVRLKEGVGGMVEWSTLTDRLVVKETSFFRHEENCSFIRRFIQQRIKEGGGGESFDIWSVGCSTGEEPYTLAMIACDCFEEASLDNYWGVTGTDISMPALAYGRAGVYPKRKLDMLPNDEKQRYFEEIDQTRYQVIKKLRSRVCFAHGNVTELKKLPPVKMDLISCHNMLIYFRRWRRRKILNTLAERLKPDGLLIIGMGEIVDWENPLLEPVHDSTVQAYRRKA